MYLQNRSSATCEKNSAEIRRNSSKLTSWNVEMLEPNDLVPCSWFLRKKSAFNTNVPGKLWKLRSTQLFGTGAPKVRPTATGTFHMARGFDFRLSCVRPATARMALLCWSNVYFLLLKTFPVVFDVLRDDWENRVNTLQNISELQSIRNRCPASTDFLQCVRYAAHPTTAGNVQTS